MTVTESEIKPMPEFPFPYSASFVYVTPEVAAEWLEHNTKNRRSNKRLVTLYGKDMVAGDWVFTGETVKFDVNGNLLDGQHRLQAIVDSGQTVLMLRVDGLTSHAQDVMDTGRKRSTADMLTLHGYSYAPHTAAIARIVDAWHRGWIQNTGRVSSFDITNSEIMKRLQQEPILADLAQISSTLYERRFGASTTAIGFALYHMIQEDTAGAMQFLDDVANMKTDGIGDPRQAVRVRLDPAVQAGRSTKQRSLSTVEQAYVILRAWRAHRRGERLTKIQVTNNAGKPMLFADVLKVG